MSRRIFTFLLCLGGLFWGPLVSRHEARAGTRDDAYSKYFEALVKNPLKPMPAADRAAYLSSIDASEKKHQMDLTDSLKKTAKQKPVPFVRDDRDDVELFKNLKPNQGKAGVTVDKKISRAGGDAQGSPSSTVHQPVSRELKQVDVMSFPGKPKK